MIAVNQSYAPCALKLLILCTPKTVYRTFCAINLA
jgi:hypothetical protein